jgi:FlaA1/EpsC-like NDP-sugar epimerase
MKNILKNKKVLITGATGGLGREFCYQLDEEIYLKAMDYITPRTQTLYNLYYE